jgi:hypothetical protein
VSGSTERTFALAFVKAESKARERPVAEVGDAGGVSPTGGCGSCTGSAWGEPQQARRARNHEEVRFIVGTIAQKHAGQAESRTARSRWEANMTIAKRCPAVESVLSYRAEAHVRSRAPGRLKLRRDRHIKEPRLTLRTSGRITLSSSRLRPGLQSAAIAAPRTA